MTSYAWGCAVVLLICHANAFFDCGRDITQCKNGATCNLDTGKCTCPVSNLFEGYDCSVITADIDDAGVCTGEGPCTGHGTCYKGVDDQKYCLCEEHWLGSTCSVMRYELGCNTDGSEMSMSIIPHIGSSFGGTVYMVGKASTCAFAGSPKVEKNGVADTDSSCGNADTSGTTRVRQAIVQFDTEIMVKRDELVTFTCGQSDTVAVSAPAVTVQPLNSALRTASRDVSPDSGDIDMVLQVGGSTVDAPVNLGVGVTVKLSLTSAGQGKFAKLRLEQCSAANSEDDTIGDYITKNFIDNNCVDADLFTSMTTGIVVASNFETSFTFEAFKYTGKATVAIKCLVKLCQDDANCVATSCSDEKRKRRAAEGGLDVIERSFLIRDPTALLNALTNTPSEEKACYQTWEMTATVVSLAVGLLLVLIICMVLVTKVILNRRSRNTYQGDDSDSTSHLPQLPRVVSNKC